MKKFIIVIVVVIIAIALVVFLMPQQDNQSTDGNNQQSGSSGQSNNDTVGGLPANDDFPPDDIFDDEPLEVQPQVYSYGGVVTSVGSDRVVFEVGNTFGLDEGTLITVLVGADTRIVKEVITEVKEDGSATGRLEPLRLDELKVGDFIDAIADEDVYGKTEYTPVSLELIGVAGG